jgi:hypothetical protein
LAARALCAPSDRYAAPESTLARAVSADLPVAMFTGVSFGLSDDLEVCP